VRFLANKNVQFLAINDVRFLANKDVHFLGRRISFKRKLSIFSFKSDYGKQNNLVLKRLF
jgi:hypothetical protein